MEHQPTAVPPQEIDERAVRVGAVVGMFVMNTVHGNPASGRVLHRADAEDRKKVFEPFWRGKPLVGQQSVVAQIDAQGAKHVEPHDAQHDAGPAKEPRQKRKARQQMHARDAERITPADFDRVDRRLGPFEFSLRRIVFQSGVELVGHVLVIVDLFFVRSCFFGYAVGCHRDLLLSRIKLR